MKEAKISAGFYRLCVSIALIFAMAVPVAAVQPDEILPNPQLESRARALSAQLRCLVCRNETIDDSNAPLARDLRLTVRERLLAGDSDAQVLDFMVARYGSYVLLKPPFYSAVFLWLFPLFVFLPAVIYLFYTGQALMRRAQTNGKVPQNLTAEEEAQLQNILTGEKAVADSKESEDKAANI